MKIKVLKIDMDLLSDRENTEEIIDKIKDEQKNSSPVIVINVTGTYPPDESFRDRFNLCYPIATLFSRLLEYSGVPSTVLEFSKLGIGINYSDMGIKIRNGDSDILLDLADQAVVPVICPDLSVITGAYGDSSFSGMADISAVAIASLYKGGICEIWSHEGEINSSNLEDISDVRKVKHLTVEEAMEMGALGFNVPVEGALDLAKNTGVDIYCMTPFSKEGTWIMTNGNREDSLKAVAYDTDTAKIALLGVPDRPGIAARIFTALAEKGIRAEMIIQSVMRGQINDIAFLVKKAHIEDSITVCRCLARETGAQGVTFDTEIARISVVGSGVSSRADVPARIFSVLAENDINIEMIAASSISVVCVVSEPDAKKAVRALHAELVSGS